MLQTDEVTTGEVTRAMGKVEASLKDLTKAVEERPDWKDHDRLRDTLRAETAAAVAVLNVEQAQQNVALKGLQDIVKWSGRTVGGAVLLAAAGWALSGGLAGF